MATDPKTMTIEEKLRAMFKLQTIDSKLDDIEVLKGELPIEVKDLEDEIEGLATRVRNLEDVIKNFQEQINKHTANIKEAENLILRYEDQQKNVKNNREYEALLKELELQGLEIQLSNKRIREANGSIDSKKVAVEEAKARLAGKELELVSKNKELKEISASTEKEEKRLMGESTEARKEVEDRMLVGYDRIRKAYRNRLAVVSIRRDSCGGCFNRIPPQKQLDIAQRKKITVCEYCGRVVVDEEIAAEVVEAFNA